MRLSLRFILPLVLVLGALAYLVAPFADRLTLRWFVRDLDIRSQLIANTVQDPLQDLLASGNDRKLIQFFARISQDERLYALAFCPAPPGQRVATTMFPADLRCDDLARFSGQDSRLLTRPNGPLLVSVEQIAVNGVTAGQLVLLHDMSFIERRSEETRRYFFFFLGGLALIVSLITVVVAQLSWRGWIRGIRALTRGEGILRPSATAEMPELRPIVRDLRAMMADLESEHRSRDADQLAWTPETLQNILNDELKDQEIIVVSNREPYIHTRAEGDITVSRPASGVVTALEPIMRACSGTWIAHGSGSADREVVDRHDHVAVPPGAPAYQLRRVWMSDEEETGYYYGFANEGLWPLCHIAHVRPTFRSEDWTQYVRINQRFAEAVREESRSGNPIVLVQDYHFALLPRMIRELLPEATVIAFWHIPWPNPEAFAICPWRYELLDGLLGSTILGFHTMFHCNNFVDTVDRMLEARVDRELFTVTHRGHATAIKRYPISIEWPAPSPPGARGARETVRSRHGLPADHAIGIGVDRLDYTKGIEERMRAMARFLELHPEWVGRCSFIQIAAPTRARIGEYQDYEVRVRQLADDINRSFPDAMHPPIVLKVAHHRPEEIHEYYRAADFAFVSSLHDGMNLVAKEFVAARDDERGVLILSQFTGASRELPEALIVNPYDIDQCAAAIHMALEMPPTAQRTRMRLMRGVVQEFNVYRWAGRMLLDAARMRRRGRLLERITGHEVTTPSAPAAGPR